MSNEPTSFRLRESEPPKSGGGWMTGLVVRVFRRLRDHFPMFVGSAQNYVDARIGQEAGKARREHAEADLAEERAGRERAEAEVVSAKAEAIRARTAIRLAHARAQIEQMIREARHRPGEEALRRALEELGALLADLDRTGIHPSAGPITDASGQEKRIDPPDPEDTEDGPASG